MRSRILVCICTTVFNNNIMLNFFTSVRIRFTDVPPTHVCKTRINKMARLTLSLCISLLAVELSFHCVESDRLYVISDNGHCRQGPNATDVLDREEFNSSAPVDCITLQEFFANRSDNLTISEDHIILELVPGKHTIEPTLSVSNVASLTIAGRFERGEDVTIFCQEAGAGLTFELVNDVFISGINFVNCQVTTFDRVKTLSLNNSVITNGTFCLLDVQSATFMSNIFSDADPDFGYYSSVRHGAVYILRTSLLVRSCNFRDNNGFEAGGILAVDSNLTVEHSVFHNNTGDGGYRQYDRRSDNSSGAIAMRETESKIRTTLTVAHSNFSANIITGGSGGAIYVSECDFIRLLACNFVNNSARLAGGAVKLTAVVIKIWISQSTFKNNTAENGGGAMSITTTVASDSDYNSLLIEQSLFVNNVGNQGGAVYFGGLGRSIVKVNSCQFRDNLGWREGSDYHAGGALYASIQSSTNSSIVIDRSYFVGNRGTYGAAMKIGMGIDRNNTATVTRTDFSMNGGDSALYIAAQRISIRYCTMTGNLNGGIHVNGENVSLFQSDFLNNSGRVLQYENNGANFDITGCTFMRNYAPSCEVMYMYGQAQMVISDSTLAYNNAVDKNSYGGAVCILSSSTVLILNSTFHRNYANETGGVFVTATRSVLRVIGSLFDSNSVSVDGGVLSSDGLEAVLEFTRCIFINNYAGNRGGVLNLGARGFQAYARFSQCSFRFNNASQGGAIHTDSSIVEVDSHISFENNTASLGGSIIRACESIIVIPDERLFDISLDNSDQDNFCVLYDEKSVNRENSSILYVQSFNITVVPSPSDCPLSVSKNPCLTLQQFIQNGGVYDQAYNLTLDFHPGHYNLLSSELTFVNKNFLVLQGINVTIQCSGSVALVKMNTIRTAHVIGISIVDCEFSVVFVRDFLLEQSTFRLDSILKINKVSNSTIKRSCFFDRPCCQLRNGYPQRIIDIYQSGSILFQDCTFDNNGDGSIYANRFSSITVDSCNFLRNRERAIITQDGDLTVTNCSFTNNTADLGGAVYATGENNQVSISKSTFFNNESPFLAYAGSGGALYFTSVHSVSVSRCSFISNRASDAGSRYPLSGGGGAIYISDTEIVMIYGCKFRNNVVKTQAGGALFIKNIQDSVCISKSTFRSNTAYTSGGAVYIETDSVCSVTFDQSMFFGNNLTRIYEYHIFPQYYADNGSALYILVAEGSSIVINQSQFLDNTRGSFPTVIQPIYIGGTENITFIEIKIEITPVPSTEATTTLKTRSTEASITSTATIATTSHSDGLLSETTTSHPYTTFDSNAEPATTSPRTTFDSYTEPTATITNHSQPIKTTTHSEITATTFSPTSETNTNVSVPSLSTISETKVDAATTSSLQNEIGTTTASSNNSKSTANRTTIISISTVIGIVVFAVICIAAVLLIICIRVVLKTSGHGFISTDSSRYAYVAVSKTDDVELLIDKESHENASEQEPDQEKVDEVHVATL